MTARLALMQVAQIRLGSSFPLTIAPSNRGPKNDEGCCGVGGASQDSAGFGAMEEGLISREGRNLRPRHLHRIPRLSEAPCEVP